MPLAERLEDLAIKVLARCCAGALTVWAAVERGLQPEQVKSGAPKASFNEWVSCSHRLERDCHWALKLTEPEYYRIVQTPIRIRSWVVSETFALCPVCLKALAKESHEHP